MTIPPAGQAGYAVIDVETTGVNPAVDRVVQIAVASLTPAMELDDAWGVYIDPGLRFIPAFHIHRITAAMVAGAPTFAAIWDRVLSAVDGRRIVGHNVAFDLAVINAELGRCGRDPFTPDAVVDTYLWAKLALPGLRRKRLGRVAYALGVPAVGAHDAVADVVMCGRVMAALRDRTAAVA